MSENLRWVNWQQGCKIMECSRSHFYNLVNSGVLRSKRSGIIKGVRAYLPDCERWAEEWRGRVEGDLEESDKE